MLVCLKMYWFTSKNLLTNIKFLTQFAVECGLILSPDCFF